MGVQPRVVEVVRTREVAPKPTAGPHAAQPSRRKVDEWVALLGELSRALATGSLYDREMLQLIQPLNGVIEAFERRSRRR